MDDLGGNPLFFRKHPNILMVGTSPINPSTTPPVPGGAQDSTEDLSRCGAEGPVLAFREILGDPGI